MWYVVGLLFHPRAAQYQVVDAVGKSYSWLGNDIEVDLVSREVEWEERGNRSLLLPEL